MRKFTFLILFILCNLCIKAQPRVNPTNNEFKIIKSSPVINSNPNIIGWMFDNYSEKWSGYYGCCYSGNGSKPKVLSSTYMSRYEDNIISIQTKLVSYKGTIYYAFVVPHWHGYYKYPSIMEGWTAVKYMNIMLADTASFNMSFRLNQGEIATIPLSYHSDGMFYNSTVDKEIEQTLKYNSSVFGCLFVKKEDDKTIRFLSPIKNYPGETEKKFGQNYYELSLLNWKKLMLR